MKLSYRGLGVLALLAAAPLIPAQKFDFNQPQSPPKPTPSWVKIIDQGRNDPRLKGYFTPEGLKVEIVAEFPVVVNPVGMTFADDGTPYVLEWLPGGTNWNEVPVTFTYKDGTKRNVATMKKFAKDVVKVLHDTKGKGVYDKSKVILQDELPSSILLHDGWLYLSGRGTVRRFKQSKPGGPYDVKQVIAQGFCGFHHHQVSGLSIGNDGWLYITTGDDDNYVEGSDGSRATVLRTGAIFRCRPDGSKFDVFSIGYRNPYRDVAFDTAFNVFHADNDNEDGSKFMGCRLMHVAEASDFGWRLRTGARCCSPDNVRGAAYGELPGRLPPMLKTGRGSPAGLLIYHDTRFPENYRGLLYYPDVFRKLIRAYRVEPSGATFEVAEEFEFMKSEDPLFRPCQMVLGPDGAMYICDWRTNSGGAGQLSGDAQHGRIYRVSWGGTKDDPAIPLRPMDSWDIIVKMPDEGLLKALANEDFSDRRVAQREISRRGEKLRPALVEIVADGKRPLAPRIAALGALQSLWDDEVHKAFIELVHDAEPDVRRLAAEGLALNCRPGDLEANGALLEKLGDADLPVRRAVALAMGKIGAPGAADSLVNALKFDETGDIYLQDGLARAIERAGKPGIEKLLALAESGVAKDRDKVIETFRALRTRAAAEAIPSLLKYPHLTTVQKASLLRSYGNYLLDPPISLEPVVDYLTAHPQEDVPVKLAALDVLALAGDPSSPCVVKKESAGKLLVSMLDDRNTAVRLAAIHAIAKARLATAAPRMAQLLGQDPAAGERLALTKALRVLNDRSAVPVLKEILAKNSDGTAEHGAIRLEAFRTLAALDPEGRKNAARGYLDQKDAGLQSEAVQVLGTLAAGAKLVGERFLAKKLPRELLPQVSEALRKHADKNPDLAAMLTDVMKGGLLLSLDKAEVERIRELVRTKGDPNRGKALFLNSKALACVTCHRLEGVGGNVGPDLTRIWDTQSVEKIMESMIEPSKEIKEGYQTYVATTKKGQVITGLKVAQTRDEVVLRDANTKEIHIPTRDLDELAMSKESLMPANVISQLTFDQFIDLVAFLTNRAAQESLQGVAREFWVVGPFGEDLKTSYAPETHADAAASYVDPKDGVKRTWQPREADSTGYLNLRAVFNRDHIAAYALTYVYSPKAQKVLMLVGSDDTVRVWLNGALVHEYTTPRSARPDEDRVDVTLKDGWNVVLAKVVNVEADHGLYLRFQGGQGLRGALKPEGK